MEHAYLKRIVDKELDFALEASGAVLIEGPKWCGKTRTAKERAASALFMQDPDNKDSYLQAADTKPSLLLIGDVPRLLDEWQVAPALWDAVRHAVDIRESSGQFILTGSAVPKTDPTRHTGTGRFSRILMRPMSLYESQESNGAVALSSLFGAQADVSALSTLSIEGLAFALARGGWPATIGAKETVALKRVHDYIDSVINFDISNVDEVEKNPTRVLWLLRSLARNVSTMANMTTLRKDVSGDEEAISEKSIASYLSALRRIFVLEDLPAWSPAMRSKTGLRTSSKRHFIDPSIAAAVLRASPERLLQDFNTFGYLFESLCIRDLRVYAQAIDGKVFHYREKTGLEVDAIVQLMDGRWGAIEIKMGSAKIDEAALNLIKLKDKIDADKMREPSFLMVLTATEFAYQREDGIYVVPIGCLKD